MCEINISILKAQISRTDIDLTRDFELVQSVCFYYESEKIINLPNLNFLTANAIEIKNMLNNIASTCKLNIILLMCSIHSGVSN